jgi:hypothetical protein
MVEIGGFAYSCAGVESGPHADRSSQQPERDILTTPHFHPPPPPPLSLSLYPSIPLSIPLCVRVCVRVCFKFYYYQYGCSSSAPFSLSVASESS